MGSYLTVLNLKFIANVFFSILDVLSDLKTYYSYLIQEPTAKEEEYNKFQLHITAW